jgi:hypothetical protein
MIIREDIHHRFTCKSKVEQEKKFNNEFGNRQADASPNTHLLWSHIGHGKLTNWPSKQLKNGYYNLFHF